MKTAFYWKLGKVAKVAFPFSFCHKKAQKKGILERYISNEGINSKTCPQ